MLTSLCGNVLPGGMFSALHLWAMRLTSALHCGEPLGIVLATERYDGREPVNLGAGREVTIKQLVETIVRLCGFEGETHWDPSKPDGQPRRMLDTSRAKELFGFEAESDLEDGLRRTIDWYAGVREQELAKAA